MEDYQTSFSKQVTRFTKKHRILIADDDLEMVKALSQRLEFAGFETSTAQEGIRVIEKIHKEKPDLVILDLKMPVGGGQFVLHALRSRPETMRVPVIVMTGISGPNIEKEAKEAGADEFIRKPYEDIALMQKIRSLLP